MLKRFCSIVLMITMLFLLSACSNAEDDKKFYDYSVGLDKKGLYATLNEHMVTLPDFSKLSFTYDEVIQHAINLTSTDSENKISVDDFVKTYGEELLTAMGLTKKSTVENGDICNISLKFELDGKVLDNYSSDGSYKADANGDSIVKSLIGHTKKDEYEVEYTFPADSKEYASKTASVTVVINEIFMSDPIGDGVVEKNLDVIQKHLDGVTNSDSFLTAIKPYLAKSNLALFVEEYLQSTEDIDVPQEYIEHEYARFRCRIQEIGYIYSDYLKASKTTHEEVLEYCKSIARKNYICMIRFVETNTSIIDEEFSKYYGDTLEYIKSVQGEPYMYMKIIKDKMVLDIANTVKLVESK